MAKKGEKGRNNPFMSRRKKNEKRGFWRIWGVFIGKIDKIDDDALRGTLHAARALSSYLMRGVRAHGSRSPHASRTATRPLLVATKRSRGNFLRKILSSALEFCCCFKNRCSDFWPKFLLLQKCLEIFSAEKIGCTRWRGLAWIFEVEKRQNQRFYRFSAFSQKFTTREKGVLFRFSKEKRHVFDVYLYARTHFCMLDPQVCTKPRFATFWQNRRTDVFKRRLGKLTEARFGGKGSFACLAYICMSWHAYVC